MPKFKVGDRVILIQDSVVYEDLKKGEKGTVIEESDFPFVKWDNTNLNCRGSNGWAVSQSKLALLPEQSKVLSSPKKSLLQSGDTVVYRDGSKRFVLIETGTLHAEDGRLKNNLDAYRDNLTITYNKCYDIMEVYRNNEPIMQRTEKSERELKIEELQRKIDEIKVEMEGLK
jgi:hypothetical protein